MSSEPGQRQPRSLGTSFHQDKSIEVFKNAGSFFSRHFKAEDEERALLVRLALRPCLILGSATLVGQFLRREDDDFYNGLKDFFFGLFGHSILFADGADAVRLREALSPLFNEESVRNYGHIVDNQVDKWVQSLLQRQGQKVILYEEFKRLSLVVNLKVFLGVDMEQEPDLLEELSSMATSHWHGIISVPLNVKLPMLVSSSYRRAMEAKEAILAAIKQRLAADNVPFLNRFKSIPDMTEDQIANHVLIFVCALIPKAAASVLTSLSDTVHLWHDKAPKDDSGNVTKDYYSDVLTEVLRMWPPFVGSFRVAKRDTKVGDFFLPKGHAVFPATLAAHRDPLVFPYPDKFLPERWSSFNADDRDKVFGFGAGPHGCVGERFMWRFMTTAASKLFETCKWDWGDESQGQERHVKYLPVLRPKILKEIEIKKRQDD